MRVRLRRNGSRKPSPGQKRAGSWPFGLRSSRLRPSRAARSACTRSTSPTLYIVRYREKADSPGQPGRCNSPRPGSAHDSGNHPAVTHRPGKKPPGPWITASLALASDGPRSLGDFCVRWPLHRNAFGDQGGAPLGSASWNGSGFARDLCGPIRRFQPPPLAGLRPALSSLQTGLRTQYIESDR